MLTFLISSSVVLSLSGTKVANLFRSGEKAEKCDPGCKCDNRSCSNFRRHLPCEEDCGLDCENQGGNRVPESTAVLKIRHTADKGRKAVAKKRILKGAYVCEYRGNMLTDQLLNVRREMGDTLVYTISVEDKDDGGTDEGLALDASECGSLAAFVNHSCTPNARFQYVSHCLCNHLPC